MRYKSAFIFKVVSVALVVACFATSINAAWDDYDTTFGFGGIAYDNVTGHIPHSVAVQSDGKILVAGYRTVSLGGNQLFLRRYYSNGNIDTTFGTNGAAAVPAGGTIRTDYRGEAILIRTDGKIAVAGEANGFYAVWQFTSRGAIDKTFGDDGIQVLSGYPYRSGGYPEINNQGSKILLTIRKKAGVIGRIVLVRLNSNGPIDTTFGISGESETTLRDWGAGTVVEPTGLITIGGTMYADEYDKGLDRKTANGQPVPNFIPETIYGIGMTHRGMVKTLDGKFLVQWGQPTDMNREEMMRSVYRSSGEWQSKHWVFGGVTDPTGASIFARRTDGKIISENGGYLVFSDPEPQPGPGADATNRVTWMGNNPGAALQPDDKLVLASVYNGNLVLVRLGT